MAELEEEESKLHSERLQQGEERRQIQEGQGGEEGGMLGRKECKHLANPNLLFLVAV